MDAARILNIVGSRQVGKTTLVRNIFGQGKFISLDDMQTYELMRKDPKSLLRTLTGDLHDVPLVIDEAQRCLDMVLEIKRIVDENRRKGQFVLTGSSDLFTSTKVADSLAGRTHSLQLWPLTVAEVNRRPPPELLDWAVSAKPDILDLPKPEVLERSDYIDFCLRGGYPEMRDLSLPKRQIRYREYIKSIMERDIDPISSIRKHDTMRKLIRQMSARTACEINVAEMCKGLNLQYETFMQYVSILLRLSLLVKLDAWSSRESRQGIKSSKYHFADMGIAAALRGMDENTFGPEGNPSALGGFIESFVFAELLRSEPYQKNRFEFYHWRGKRGREVDILAETPKGHLVAIEVKSSTRVSEEDFKHLDWFATQGSGKRRKVTRIVFYLGDMALPFGGDRRYVLPVSMLWAW